MSTLVNEAAIDIKRCTVWGGLVEGFISYVSLDRHVKLSVWRGRRPAGFIASTATNLPKRNNKLCSDFLGLEPGALRTQLWLAASFKQVVIIPKHHNLTVSVTAFDPGTSEKPEAHEASATTPALAQQLLQANSRTAELELQVRALCCELLRAHESSGVAPTTLCGLPTHFGSL